MNQLRASWRLGPHVLAGRAVLAPLSGVTDPIFRRIAEGFGAAYVVSEMVAADQLAAGDEEARLRAECGGLSLAVVQLAGCEPGPMAEGARVAEASGAAMIDLNMGCPAKRVTNGWSGSALMRDLDQACRLIEAVRGAVSVPVTVKMRLGWDEAGRNAPELARRAEDLGVVGLTVHGRTRQQFYTGTADWRAVGETVAATRLPVIVNGDIGTPEAARRALDESGAAAVMIGRAALGRPWLVGGIGRTLDGEVFTEPSAEEKAAAIGAHYRGLVALMGERPGVRHARKHVAAYCDEAERSGRAVPAALRQGLLTEEEPERVAKGLEALFRGGMAAEMPDAA